MSFDALHVIWTTYNSSLPLRNWSDLCEFYQRLEHEGHYHELSAPLSASGSPAAPHDGVALSENEQSVVETYLAKLMAPNGDRIAENMPIVRCALTSTIAQLLFVPSLAEHGQIIGRLKSKTASQVLAGPERAGQKRIWSRGYWFANLNGADAVARVEQFIENAAIR